MRMKQVNLKKQLGVGLVEIMIGLIIAGVGAAVVLNYQAKAQATQDTQNAISSMQNAMSKVKSFIGSSGNYNAITGKMVNQLSPVLTPLSFDGTNMLDQNGNVMNWVGNAVGSPASYVSTYGGATKALSSESCAQYASGLSQGADVITIGGTATPVTTTNGMAAGGHAYKTATGAIDPAKLADGCSETNPVIAVQMH